MKLFLGMICSLSLSTAFACDKAELREALVTKLKSAGHTNLAVADGLMVNETEDKVLLGYMYTNQKGVNMYGVNFYDAKTCQYTGFQGTTFTNF